MKISKSLFLAFAGLGLFACSNEDVTTGVDNSGDNSIVIKLDGLSAEGRSIGAPETNTTTTISDVAILLSDGTNILKKQVLSYDKSGDSDWSKLTGSNSGYIIHNVNSHVREVHVIGNYTKNSTVSTWVTSAEQSTVAAMKDVVVKAASEQDFDGVTLYGVDSELTTVAGGDANSPHDTDTPSKMLYADVTINHLVSRIEIGNIKCKDLGSTYNELTLKYIGLLNYYNQTTIGGTASDAMTLETVLEPTAGNATPAQGKHSWSNTSETADYKWAWDAFPADAKLTSSSSVYNPEASPETEDVTEKFVYQFIPSQVGGANFNVKLYLDAKENNAAAATSALNTVTANFTGDSDFKYLPGKIYKLDFEFSEDNIGPWNPDETICVKVHVTVQPWEIKALTPTFE